MGKITFIIGGARSGKSKFALRLAKKSGKRTAFIATCLPLDSEMQKRVRLHRRSRPAGWKTYEEPKDIASLLTKVRGRFDCVIIDCLTLWVSNLLLSGIGPKDIEARMKKILAILKKNSRQAVIVSNEVGLGIVPPNKLARDFRDIAGRVNQITAAAADEVFFMAAGLSLKLK